MSDRPHLGPCAPWNKATSPRGAGHGVDVLLRVYAGCIDGHEHMWNGRIEDALKDGD
ncbi:hypothetical protein [Actinomadura luteofluorescens]